ncbi:MAG: hypothetical protein JNL12_21230 [Planctomycetes bacterium]|nr:hypothetical protein [Planctomycetota bacterium]
MIARLFPVLIAALMLGLGVPSLSSVRAQAPGAAAQKQDLARTKFKELTERMQRLMPELQASEPESSSLLRAGLTFAQEKKLQQRLDQAGELLKQERWDESLVVLGDLQTDLGRLLELLQNRNADLHKLLEEIAQLEQWKNRVAELTKEQQAEKEASARTEALQEHLADLEHKKARAEALLAQQQQLRDDTNKLGVQAAANATQPLADKEAQLQHETDKLAKDLERTEQKDAELKKAAGKAGDPKAGEPKAGEPKAGEPKEGGQCSGSAGKAAQSMGQAQKQLGDKKPESSLKDQDHALQNLKQTLQEIEKMTEEARRELLKLPLDQQAKAQEKTQHATDTLAKEMEKAEEPNENGESKPSPGKNRVQQAVPKQRAAAGQLKEYKPAKQKQQDAKEDLEAAQKELEEALAQLRQQLVDEVLRALEERFTAMLAVQRELTAQTKTLHGTRNNVVLTASGELPSALIAKIKALADGENCLEVEAGDALKLLEEDATTAIFPPMVEELRDQLSALGKRLAGNDTAEGTQDAQREVEDLLAMLINALRKVIEQREGGQCKGQCNGKPPLVPRSAELKMLRYLQERVNKATKEFDERDGASKNAADAEALAKKQAKVHDLMRRLADKIAKEESEEGQ